MQYAAAEIKEFAEKPGGVKTISGYAAAFGNMDSHGDVIVPGAFLNTIEEAKERKINLYSSHSMDARDLLGTVTVLREQEGRLYFEAEFSQAASAQDIAIKAKEGHLNEVSIGFYVVKQEFRAGDTNVARYITEIKLIEISLVSRASNPLATTLSVKNENKPNKGLNMSEDNKENLENKPLEAKTEVVKAEETKETSTDNSGEYLAKIEALSEQMKSMETLLNQPQKKTPYGEIEEVKEENNKESSANLEMKHFVEYIRGDISQAEYKALSSSSDKDGGVLVPETLKQQILEKKDQINVLEAMVETIPVNSPLSIIDFDFTETFNAHGEVESVTIQDIANAFGKNTLDPQDFDVICKVPKRLERRSFAALQPLIAKRYARKHKDQVDSFIMLGTGVNQPVGVVTMLNDLSANTVSITSLGGLVYGDLVDCVIKLDQQYRDNGAFFLHKNALGQIMKLTDDNNLPIWNRPVAQGNPSTLLGYPVFEIPSLDDGGSSGETPIVFGDMSMYVMAVELGFNVEVLRELYAGNKQIGLKMGAAYDGMPTDVNAFAQIKIS